MKRALLLASLILATAFPSFAQTTFYYPQVADGVLGGIVWRTTIFITNPAASGTGLATGSITFTKSDGTTFNLSFVNESGQPMGSGNTIGFQIAGGQTRKFISTGGQAYQGGYATVTSTA